MTVWTQDPSTRPAPMAEATLPQSLAYRLKTTLLGAPLTRQSLQHQRLPKVLALGVLASDCISSSAYGSEEMLIVLLPAFGLAGFSVLLPLTAVILVVLTIVSLSYLDVVSVYTKTGGSYVVARENFGPVVAQVGAVALMLDYIVTVAVQSAAGTAALTSAVPELSSYMLEITVAVVLLLCYGNLRGIREAGKAFALPTYLFAGSVLLVLGIGVVREFLGDLPQYTPGAPGTVGLGSGSTQVLTWTGIFLLLRAFANGGSSLTGLEAISNGVSVFKQPESANARKTLIAMSITLGTLVAGVSWLAHQTHAEPYTAGTPTVISQVASAVLGPGLLGHALYLFVQLATMLILWTGANTPFSGFPFLASFVAEDQFLPRQLTRRGHRLAFSNGIIVLTIAATALLLFTRARVDQLVAFYAIGVFTGFTLAGFGMAKYFATRRQGPWRRKVTVNLASGAVSFTVVVIFAVVKFTEGAWLIVLIFPIAVAALIRLNRQYRREAAALAVVAPQSGPGSELIAANGSDGEHANGSAGNGFVPRPRITRHDVIVLTDGVDLATVAAVRYARSLKPAGLRAVHFVVDDVHADQVRQGWAENAGLRDVPLHLIDCPDRRLTRAVLELAARETMNQHTELTLLLPRRTYAGVLGRLLHDHTADEIARATSRLPRVVATVVPFDVAGLIARREASVAGARRHAAARAAGLAAGSALPDAPVLDGGRPAGAGSAPAEVVGVGVAVADGQRPGSGPAENGAGAGSTAAARRSAGLLVAAGSRRAPARTPIGELQWRQRAAVEGHVRSVRLAPMSGAPSVEVDLWDETGGVTLVFFGRRSVPGIKAGTHLAAEGMVGNRGGRLAICNPLYRLLDASTV